MKTQMNSSVIFKIILTVLFLNSAFLLKSFAQFTELTGLAGYTFAEKFNTTDGYEVYISDGFTYGGSLAYYPNEHFDIALTYTRQDAHANVYDYIFGGYVTDIPVSVNYVMIGGDRNQVVSDKATFFGGLNLGAAGIEPKESQYSGRWKFAFDLHLGAKIFPTPNVGIRMQAGINFPVQYFGAAFTVGTGGSGAGVSASSTITQVCLLGGLIFRIHPK